MKFDKRLVLIAAIVTISLSTTAYAFLWRQRQVDISGGIATMGNIQVYNADGVTPVTSYAFADFTPGEAESEYAYWFINNTGNTPVYVSWNMSESTITWRPISTGYFYPNVTSPPYTFLFAIEHETTTGLNPWVPAITGIQVEYLLIGVGQGIQIRILNHYYGTDPAALTYDMTLNFYAVDTY